MSAAHHPVPAPGRVLSTLNPDGSRRWLRPKPSRGRWFKLRQRVAYALMFVFFIVPYLRMGGKPLILLDLPRREFTLFGTTFLSDETLLFMLLFVALAIAVFLITALLGRVWCGWACPQTVYLEYLFRPVERLLEGGWLGSHALDQKRRLDPRRIAKYLIYAMLASFLAHTFLAYFVGIDQLVLWVQRSPAEHPTSFFVMLGTTALIFFDFAYFREQTCVVACPYGRLQAVLLDRQSLIVGYDTRRGEPRQKGIKDRPAGAGDCIDCRLCVITCPTGIDIREGLQMECIHCTQCADACDRVMTKIGKPPGLIRYTSRDRLEAKTLRIARPRVLLYPLALAGTLGLFLWSLGHRAEAEVTLLRGIGEPYTVEVDGSVVNQIRIKIVNRGHADRRYQIALEAGPRVQLIAPINPFPVEGGKAATTSVFAVAPQATFGDGERPIRFRIADGVRFSVEMPYRLLGPESGRPAEHGREPEAARGREALGHR